MADRISEIREKERLWYQEWSENPRDATSVHRHHREIQESLDELFALAGVPPRQGATGAGAAKPVLAECLLEVKP